MARKGGKSMDKTGPRSVASEPGRRECGCSRRPGSRRRPTIAFRLLRTIPPQALSHKVAPPATQAPLVGEPCMVAA
jgi:hypothetical protein